MRRRLAWCVSAAPVSLLLARSPIAQDNYQATDPNVDNIVIVRYARMAVGGGAVSKLKALEFKGTSRVEIPFHVTTSAGGRAIDDLRFDQVLVNPEIGKGDFGR